MEKYKYVLFVPAIMAFIILIQTKPEYSWLAIAIPIALMKIKIKKELKTEIKKEDLDFDPEKMTKTIDMSKVEYVELTDHNREN